VRFSRAPLQRQLENSGTDSILGFLLNLTIAKNSENLLQKNGYP
jgi:hypothetical protein